MIDKGLVILLYEKQKGKCYYCHCDLLEEAKQNIPLHIDHIKPKNKKGGNEEANLALTCRWCNCAKNDRTKKEFLEYIKPYLDGKVDRYDLSEFKKYKKLHKKFKGLVR